jgi:hypothetical protein
MRRPLRILPRAKGEPWKRCSIAEGLGFEDPLQTRLKVRRREESRYLR